jgi:hypothetical protein
MSKARYCAAGNHLAAPIKNDHFVSGGGKAGKHRLAEENFLADVFLIAKRTLAEDDFRLFRFRYLLGAAVKLCAARLGMDFRTCEQRLAEIESVLGAAFRDTRPYSVFPIGEYFRNTRMEGGVKACGVPLAQGRVNGVPLRPPLS